MLAGGTAAAAVLVAAYCVTYTWLTGRAETFNQSLAWSLANICPWLLAIESAKRVRKSLEFLAVFLAATMASVALGYLLGASSGNLPFELARRAPTLVLSAGCAALLRADIAFARHSSSKIPVDPQQIDWVRAAGNYIELRVGERTVIHRGSISAAARDLSRYGFIRIHRSILVRRDGIARVRPQDLILRDGTHLPIGKRYRASITS